MTGGCGISVTKNSASGLVIPIVVGCLSRGFVTVSSQLSLSKITGVKENTYSCCFCSSLCPWLVYTLAVSSLCNAGQWAALQHALDFLHDW